MRFVINAACCIIMLIVSGYDYANGNIGDGLFCSVVSLFTGFNAWLEVKMMGQ